MVVDIQSIVGYVYEAELTDTVHTMGIRSCTCDIAYLTTDY